jgi:hypothetical protein
MRRWARTAALLALCGGATPAAQAGDFFCLWNCYRAPPPVHVYDYTRGPVWTSNGWAYVPVEVQFPTPPPPVPYVATDLLPAPWIGPGNGRPWPGDPPPGLK